MPFANLRHSNTSKEEWETIRTLSYDRTIVIKKADKGSCVIVWDKTDCLLEAKKQLNDASIYKILKINLKINF